MPSLSMKSSIMKKVILLVLYIAVAGCSKTIDAPLEDAVKAHTFIDGNNRRVHDLNIKDPEYVEFQKWLNNNKEGWKSSYGSFLPNILINSKGYGYNIINGLVILNIVSDKESSHQYVKSYRSSELRQVLLLGKMHNKTLNKIGAKDVPPG